MKKFKNLFFRVGDKDLAGVNRLSVHIGEEILMFVTANHQGRCFALASPPGDESPNNPSVLKSNFVCRDTLPPMGRDGDGVLKEGASGMKIDMCLGRPGVLDRTRNSARLRGCGRKGVLGEQREAIEGIEVSLVAKKVCGDR